MEAPCRKAPASSGCLRTCCCLAILGFLLISQVSAQPPVLSPGNLVINHQAGTSFLLQLTSNIAVTYTLGVTSFDGKDHSNLFTITSSNVLESTDALHIDTAGPSKLLILTVTATAVSNGLTAQSTFTVFIVSNNQGVPVFMNETMPGAYAASIDEDVVAGTEVITVDAQVPGGGTAVLTFVPQSDVFRFFGQKIVLATNNTLDREVKDVYNLTIQATNGIQFKRTQVLITVNDVNDNTPVMAVGQIGYLYSHDLTGSFLHRIIASDKDVGENKRLNFSIVSGTYKDSFRIDSATGDIYTTVNAFTLPSMLNLTIGVQDSGIPPRSTTGNLQVILLVANNSAPSFLVNLYTVDISEDRTVPSEILQVNANDSDPNEAGTIRYALAAVPVSADGQPIFSIDSVSGVVSLVRRVDFEGTQVYMFNITATDLHLKPLAATTNVVVNVLDENDNSPNFTQPSYRTTISENRTINFDVFDLRTRVTDIDSGVNKAITFHLYSPIDDLFKLDTSSGIISVNGTLSSKVQPLHTLYIYAEDGGTPALRANVTVYVNILEENDFVPSINIPASLKMFETNGTTVNIPFFQVNVTDGDGGPSGNVSLSIVSGDTSLFRVQQYAHGLYYTRPVDYESAPIKSWTLTLMAIDAGFPKRSSTKNLTINLEDWNEFSPEFTLPEYIGGVDLSTQTPLGTALVQVSATDADGLYNDLTYSITGGLNNTEFTIDSKTGIIANGGSISETKNFTLTVTATDNGIPFTRNGTVEVTIRVLHSQNVHDPIFVQTIFNISINETTAIGTQIARVNTTDKDRADAGAIFYVQQSGLSEFEVDATTGAVTTKINFDYDNGARIYFIIVQARDMGAFRARTSPIPASIEVHIINNNDHAPQFILTPYSSTVAENAAVNETLPVRVLAVDTDGPTHPSGVVRYSIAPGPGSTDFKVDPVTGQVAIAKPLDYETRNVYNLVVVATDGATQPKNATASYTITITDVNDNSPVYFAPQDTTVSVDEEQPAGTYLTTVYANDTDSGLKGQITYSVDPTLVGLFAVGATTGRLTTAVQLDRESHTGFYNVTVTATDRGSPQRSAKITIGITVVDINDVRPTFARKSYIAPVNESVRDGQLVAIVSATDGDVDAVNRIIMYSIVGGTGRHLFTINQATGQIFKAGILDFEKVKNYTILVNATDGKFQDQALVTIRVIDINDNNPYFNQSLYIVSVVENAKANTSLVQLFVLDPDTLLDDIAVGYTLDTPGVPFAVGRSSGLVTVSGLLDYDSPPTSYDLVISCHPISDQARTYNKTIVRVSLLPFNDNPPVFVPPAFITVTLVENVRPGIIATFSTTDKDRPHQTSTFKIITAYTASPRVTPAEVSAAFTINATTGAVSNRVALDREEYTAPVLITIEATDSGIPGLIALGILQVKIDDVIDVAPDFSKSAYFFTINENRSPGLIDTLRATDNDFGDSIQFTIDDAAAQQYFDIGGVSGQLSLKQKLNREAMNNWLFNVTATDTKGFQSRALVNVTVTDYNDNHPMFVNATSYFASVSEQASVNVPVGIMLSATDEDININAEVRFAITGGTGADDFTVDPVTGIVSVAKSLDRERQSSYSLQVTVSDRGMPTLSTSTYMNITIVDTNDNRPVMNQTEYYGYIDENSNNGTPVEVVGMVGRDLVVSAYDIDESGNINSILRFAFDAPDSVPFSVNSTTGLIYASGSLDREAKPRPYILQVRARDLVGAGLLSEPATINITLQDTDDSPPVFTSPSYSGMVIESASNGTSILRVASTDADLGSNRDVTYNITAGNGDGLFDIDAQTGVVFKAGNLDFEMQNVYVLTIEARDVNNAALTDNVTVIITVTDFNDNAPVFYPSNVYTVSISETNNTDFLITTVYANDTDLTGTSNTVIRYALVDSYNGTFKLNPITGVLRTAKTIDYESLPLNQKSYTVALKAVDQGNIKLESSASVIVTIVDVNDNYPIFSPASYTLDIHENLEVRKAVLSVSATDRDATTNADLTFTLATAGNADSTFAVNPATGEITLSKSLNYGVKTRFVLTVHVHDMGVPQRSSQASVTINVLDINDNSPTFAQDTYSSTESSQRFHVPTISGQREAQSGLSVGAYVGMAGGCLVAMLVLVLWPAYRKHRRTRSWVGVETGTTSLQERHSLASRRQIAVGKDNDYEDEGTGKGNEDSRVYSKLFRKRSFRRQGFSKATLTPESYYGNILGNDAAAHDYEQIRGGESEESLHSAVNAQYPAGEYDEDAGKEILKPESSDRLRDGRHMSTDTRADMNVSTAPSSTGSKQNKRNETRAAQDHGYESPFSTGVEGGGGYHDVPTERTQSTGSGSYPRNLNWRPPSKRTHGQGMERKTNQSASGQEFAPDKRDHMELQQVFTWPGGPGKDSVKHTDRPLAALGENSTENGACEDTRRDSSYAAGKNDLSTTIQGAECSSADGNTATETGGPIAALPYDPTRNICDGEEQNPHSVLVQPEVASNNVELAQITQKSSAKRRTSRVPELVQKMGRQTKGNYAALGQQDSEGGYA